MKNESKQDCSTLKTKEKEEGKQEPEPEERRGARNLVSLRERNGGGASKPRER